MSKFSVRELMKLAGCSSQADCDKFVSLVDPERAHPREHRFSYTAQLSDMMVETDHAREIMAAFVLWKISGKQGDLMSAEQLRKLNDHITRVENGTDITDPAGVAKAMKAIGQTPYLYLRMAIIEYMNDNRDRAVLWVEYAYQVMNVFYEHLHDIEVFDTIAEFVMGVMVEKNDEGEGYETETVHAG